MTFSLPPPELRVDAHEDGYRCIPQPIHVVAVGTGSEAYQLGTVFTPGHNQAVSFPCDRSMHDARICALFACIPDPETFTNRHYLRPFFDQSKHVTSGITERALSE